MYQDEVLAMRDPNHPARFDGCLRWGQAIVNYYCILGGEYDELFFTHNENRVIEIMNEYFERYNIPLSK